MILIATQMVPIATASALGFLVLTGSIQIWHVMIIVAVLGTCIPGCDEARLLRESKS